MSFFLSYRLVTDSDLEEDLELISYFRFRSEPYHHCRQSVSL